MTLQKLPELARASGSSDGAASPLLTFSASRPGWRRAGESPGNKAKLAPRTKASDGFGQKTWVEQHATGRRRVCRVRGVKDILGHHRSDDRSCGAVEAALADGFDPAVTSELFAAQTDLRAELMDARLTSESSESSVLSESPRRWRSRERRRHQRRDVRGTHGAMEQRRNAPIHRPARRSELIGMTPRVPAPCEACGVEATEAQGCPS